MRHVPQTQESGAAPERQAAVLRALVCLLFLLFAMTSDAVGSVIAQITGQYRLSLSAAGAFHYAPMLAIAAGGLSLGSLADRLGRKRVILLGLMLYGLSSAAFALGHAFAFFLMMLVISGVGISVFKVGGLAVIGDISETGARHTQLMNAAEGFFAVGSIIGPALVATLIQMGLSWKWLYVIAALVCAGLFIATARIRFPAARSLPGSAFSVKDSLAVLRAPRALAFAALIVLYVATEVAVYVWMPSYVRRYAGSATWLPVYGLTLFFVLRAGGRFLGIWLLGRLSWSAVLALCGSAIFVCFAAASLGSIEIAAWALPVSGLPMSVVYPTLNSKGISSFPREQHGAAAGVLLFFTALSAALGPLAMAAVSDAFGDVRYGFLLATGFALLLCCGLLANWACSGLLGSLPRAAAAKRGV